MCRMRRMRRKTDLRHQKLSDDKNKYKTTLFPHNKILIISLNILILRLLIDIKRILMITSNFTNLGDDNRQRIFRKPTLFSALNYYKRSDIVYQMTVIFCHRFLPRFGDRTVDQMIQAARSTKQNIIEGLTDGCTSLETEIKLLGIARGSINELIADYMDYLSVHNLSEWRGNNQRFEHLYNFCKKNADIANYKPFFNRWSNDEMANCALCLCHMVDKALYTILEKRNQEFISQGGLKERMTNARLHYRIKNAETLQQENMKLRNEIKRLKEILAKMD